MSQRNTYRRTDPIGGTTNVRAIALQAGMMHAKPLSMIMNVEHGQGIVTVTLRNTQVFDYDAKSVVPIITVSLSD